MNHKTTVVFTDTGKKKVEVRFWGGSGETRVEGRRRFDSMREANAFIFELVEREREKAKAAALGLDDVNLEGPFAAEFENWVRHKGVSWSPGYRRNVESYWKELGPEIGEMPVKMVRPKLLREIETDLVNDGNAPQTVSHKVQMIKRVLNFAVEMERIPFNPVAKYKPAKVPKAALAFFEPEEASRFLAFAESRYPAGRPEHWKYLAYLTALNTGLRAGELWGLRVSSLRRENDVIQVTHQLDKVTRQFRPVKGKRERNVPLPMHVARALGDWIDSRKLRPRDLIFTTETSEPVHHDNFRERVLDSDMNRYGGRALNFHALRHSAATLMLDQGADIRTLQDILGHADLKTTERYVHALGRKVQTVARTFAVRPASPDEVRGARRHLSIAR